MNKYNQNKNLNEDPNSISMNQFRPNIVVKGGGKSFLEDQWLDFVITANPKLSAPSSKERGVIMKNVKSCTRCKMPSVNQTTGKVHQFNNVKNDGKYFHVEPYVDDNDDDEDTAVAEEEEEKVMVEEDEPVRTLRQFRTGQHIRHPNPKWKDEIFFGVNLVSTQASYGKSIYVGDLITVLQKQEWVTWEK